MEVSLDRLEGTIQGKIKEGSCGRGLGRKNRMCRSPKGCVCMQERERESYIHRDRDIQREEEGHQKEKKQQRKYVKM